METNLILFPSIQTTSPTVTAAQRLADQIAEAIDAVAARIPRLETPHPSTTAGVRAARTVSREFIASMIAAVEAMPELQVIETFDADDARDTLQFIDAFRPIADRLAALLAMRQLHHGFAKSKGRTRRDDHVRRREGTRTRSCPRVARCSPRHPPPRPRANEAPSRYTTAFVSQASPRLGDNARRS